MYQNRPPSSSPFSGIVGILVAIVFFFLLFKITGMIFWLIWKAAPVVFVAALVIDYTVFTRYVNSVYSLFKRNWLYGLGAGLLSVGLFPLVALYLLGMALFNRKVKKVQEQAYNEKHGELIDYEEIDSEIMDLDLPDELPPPPSRRSPSNGNSYDEYFK